jgi:hypothetical protein
MGYATVERSRLSKKVSDPETLELWRKNLIASGLLVTREESPRDQPDCNLMLEFWKRAAGAMQPTPVFSVVTGGIVRLFWESH